MFVNCDIVYAKKKNNLSGHRKVSEIWSDGRVQVIGAPPTAL